MKFGIFYHLQVPKPWTDKSESTVIHQALDQISLADRLGYDCAWSGEHHFTSEYSHISAPEAFLGAASQRTEKIRLGAGIFHLTTQHPLRVAERVGFVDVLSKGRLEFGMGEGSGDRELAPFGVNPENKTQMFEEAVQAIMPTFAGGMTEHRGKYWSWPAREVVPKPVQKPHPPLWMACSRRESIVRAGAYGLGVLGFQFVSSQSAHAWVHAYYNEFVKRRRPLTQYKPNPNMAFISFFMCAKTDEEARIRADGATFFQFCVLQRWEPSMGTSDMWQSYELWKRENPEIHANAIRGGLIGSPDTIRKKLRKFEQSGIDQVILLCQSGKNRHEHIMESLELFAKDVMPEFHGNIPRHEEWKAGVLAGDIQLDEIDVGQYTEKYSTRWGELKTA